MTQQITISVRDLVEYTLRKGSIDFRYIGKQRGALGTKAHQKVQKNYKENYSPEVTISSILTLSDAEIKLQGRIDGIIDILGAITIDEIKSTSLPLEEIKEDHSELHWAQGIVYGFLYCMENNIENIDVQLTYYQLDSKEIKKFTRSYIFNELEDYVMPLVNTYLKWALTINNWKTMRDSSIEQLNFPHESYRKGQRKMLISIYKSIQEENRIFASAPTGIGKTISTLYPAILSFKEKQTEKIFYLTSKNTQKEAAEDTLRNLCSNSLKVKFLSLTAKDKICFKEESQCHPEYCEYAKGHFDRLNKAIEDIFANEGSFTQEIIEEYAEKHKICPFEFSLDLSLYSDIILCDYNYIFDPRVSLKRYTEEKGKYIFLIDEAHNLVNRSRTMYSAAVSKRDVLQLKKALDKTHKLYPLFDEINKELLNIKKDEEYDPRELPDTLIDKLRVFIYRADKWLSKKNNKEYKYQEILQFYFEVNNFIRISEYFGNNFRVLRIVTSRDVQIKLLCLDASEYIGESVNKGISAVFFSATLLPIEYYIQVLGGDIEEDYHMQLDYPFLEDNVCLIVNDNINTTYKHRGNSIEEIIPLLEAVYKEQKGNYLVFFPSYAYMERVYEKFIEIYEDIPTIVQEKLMLEEERSKFIASFEEEKGIMAFAVLGGIFSESIDLKGDKLLGTVVISVGLPMFDEENNFIKDYYDQINSKGYQYAYLYPGFNKVMQGVGRVIRSEEDRGVILLIDQRFARRDYQKLFPKHWKKAKTIKNAEELEKRLVEFWEKEFSK